MRFHEVLAATRKTIHFSEEPVPDEAVLALIRASYSVPTHFNLRPAHFWVVTDKEQKSKLLKICLNNNYVIEAPAIIVFSASRYVTANQREAEIDNKLEAGALSVSQAESLEQQMNMYFDVSPIGLGWFGKLLATPILRLFTDMPQLACIHKREWLTRQVMRNAALFWFCAQDAGYSAEFIEMYDEWRLKAELGMPWHHIIVSVIALGYPQEQGPSIAETGIDEVIHWNK